VPPYVVSTHLAETASIDLVTDVLRCAAGVTVALGASWEGIVTHLTYVTATTCHVRLAPTTYAVHMTPAHNHT